MKVRLLPTFAAGILVMLAGLGELHAQDEPYISAPPFDDILTTLQNIGLDPINEPALVGPYYVLHAYDPYGTEMRVVADAQFGDILSIDPAGNWSTWSEMFAPRYRRAPRIIHIPR